ncbi:MAG: hypothetical protein GX927_06145 [Lentisphaerae bacterium]|jgi:hypothetical protein|nr:hypothetical protein [Lentisphaerota bacterium]
MRFFAISAITLCCMISTYAFDINDWSITGQAEKISAAAGTCQIQLAPTKAASISSLTVDDGHPIITRKGANFILTRNFPVTPGQVYLLQLRVKSSNSVVMSCAKRRLAYSLPGQSQLLCDLVKSGSSPTLEVKIELGGLPGESTYELSQFELRKPHLADNVPPRPYLGTTQLNENVAIIYPAGLEDAARQVQLIVREKCGLQLTILTDSEAVYEDRPVIREELKQHPLILLGRLGNNRAIWGAYNQFLAAADAYYPGEGGYVLRTAANVFGNGANHIVLGGSDEAGIRQAVNEFCKLLESPQIPFLLQIKLGGKCKEAFDADEKLWASNPEAAGPRLLAPGYGKVVRWYVNVMNYYWSGLDSYRQRSRIYLQEILADHAYTHHYILEFFVRAYNMVQHSDLFSSEERSQLDSLLKDNFMEFLTGPDLQWMMLFNRPYESLVVMNRHSIAPWMADLTLADFLAKNVALTDDEQQIVRYRREEKHEFMKYWAANTFNVSLPRNLYAGSEEEVIASLFRYALSNEQYALFNSGNARKALRLWEMSPARPSQNDDRLIAGILASYYRDPGFVWLHRQMPEVKEHFQMRYVNGVHRYAPDTQWAAKEPMELTGVQITPLQRQDYLLWNAVKFKQHRQPDFPAAEGAEKICFRSGFKPDDDFMLISGLGDEVGNISEFRSHGLPLLLRSNSSTFGAGSASYYDCNALTVQRLDKWMQEEQPYAGAARLQALHNGGDHGSVIFSLSPFVGCQWQRTVIWLKKGLYLVRDRVTALENGEYLLRIGWRPQGIPDFTGNLWTGANGKHNFYLTSLGKDFKVVENLADYRSGKAPFPKYHHSAHVKLSEGQSVSAYTLLEVTASSNQPTPFILGEDETVKIGEAILQLSDAEKPPQPIKGAFKALAMQAASQDSTVASHADSAILQPFQRLSLLQLPGKVRFHLRGGMVDFGKVLQLSEIRHAYRSRLWERQPLPDDLEYSVDGQNFHRILSEKAWRSGVKTANYGQADPQEESHQYTLPDVQARYIRGSQVERLTYYSADFPNRRSDLELKPAKDGFLAQTNVYPRYLRDRRSEDYVFALFDSEFQLQFTWISPDVVQDSKLLSWPGKPTRLCVVTDDAKIRFLGLDGKLEQTIDLYQLQAGFHARYGKQNSRQPAGGFTLPFSVGTWKVHADEEPLLVLGRYCYCSFVNAKAELDGVMPSGEYSMNSLLSQSVDLDGDGQEEQYGLGTYNLCKIYGERDVRIVDGVPFSYQRQNYSLPASSGKVEADKMLCFTAFEAPFLLVARQSFLAFFNARAGHWSFSWAASIPLTAVAQVGRQEILAASEDDLLLHLTFDPSFSKVVEFRSVVLTSAVRNIRHYHGNSYIATAEGLFHYDNGNLSLLYRGNCRDVAVNRAGKVMILLDNGELLLCKERKLLHE